MTRLRPHFRSLWVAVCRALSRDPVAFRRIARCDDAALVGDAACGWVVPLGSLRAGMTAYCVGAGEDITFDVALARDHRVTVFTFDPTPRAIAHVEKVLAREGPVLVFKPWGVWSRDEVQRFYEPECPGHVSHSIVNLQKTKRYFEATCRSLPTIQRELSHAQLDLLKLDVEGAEYVILEHMLACGIGPGLLLVEFDEWHHPMDSGARQRMGNAISRLLEAGYQLFSASSGNYCFRR